jgi:hypothetical protein
MHQTCLLIEINYSRSMTFKDWIDIAQITSIFIASLVAVYGIEAWRREFVGKRRIELAEEVLALFYQAKDVIGWIRFPAGPTGESSTRKSETVETPHQKQIRDEAYVISKRLNEHSELFSRIRTLRYRFMAQFGKDASVPFDDLKSILDEILVAANLWVMLSQVDTCKHDPQQLQAHRAKIDEREKILWGMGKDDPISVRIESVVKDIERICRPHIDRKSKIQLLFMKLVSRLKRTYLAV